YTYLPRHDRAAAAPSGALTRGSGFGAARRGHGRTPRWRCGQRRAACGRPSGRARRDWPAGLTAREVEVLRLVARGLANREIAKQLVISSKTAGNHVEHIYAKTGVSNRARASLFALQHGLMADG